MQIHLPFDKWRHIFEASFPDLDKYGSIYKDIHQHPELPCQESQTAALVAGHLESLGYQVQRHIEVHGVVGMGNGNGKTPIKEDTGLPYASKVKQVDADGCTKWVMHACGHDMHMASVLGAADLLQKVKDTWSGTLAMIDDGLFDKIPPPDIVLGQHAVPTKAGTIGTRPGRVLGFLDSLDVRVYGKGIHSSTPELGIDPILMGSCIISRLQMIVAREIDFEEPCVVTCGTFNGGTDASIIPDYADFKVDIRSFNKDVQLAAVNAVNRIIQGECQAANSPKSPRILTAARCPPIDNDEEATARFT